MIRKFKARLKPPVYTILEVGRLRTKLEVSDLNEELARAGTDIRVKFTKGSSYDITPGTPQLYGPMFRAVPVSGDYIVVGPRGEIMQTNHIANFEIL